MHEWALAEAVTMSVSRYAKDAGVKKIRRLVVALGELQAIDREIFEFALSETMRSVGIEVESLELVTEEVVFECNACGYVWRLKDLALPEAVRESIHFLPEAVFAYVKCPRCGSPDFTIVRGRGLSIVGVEL